MAIWLCPCCRVESPLPHPVVRSRESWAPKPGVLVLLSPWLSQHHRPSKRLATVHVEVLSGPFLAAATGRFLTLTTMANVTSSPWVELSSPGPAIDWTDVLLLWICVSAGQNNVLFRDMESWLTRLVTKLKCRRVNVGGRDKGCARLAVARDM